MAKKSISNRKKVIKIVSIVLALILILYISYTLISLIVKPTDKYYVKIGTIYNEESQEAYIVREETLIQNSDKNSKNDILPIKTQGEKVAKDTPIFRYYSKEEKQIKDNINKINSQIQEKLDQNAEVFSSDIKSLENQIEKKIDGFKYKSDIQEIIEYKKDIDTYINKKAEIKINLSSQNEDVLSLLEQKKNYESQLEQTVGYVKAPTSGSISYRIDDLENVLIPDNLDNLTKESLDKLNLKTGQIVATSNKTAKIVNNFEAHLVIISNSNEAKQCKIGDKVYVRLSTRNEINAIVEKIKQDGKNYLITLKINNDVEKLIDYRKISVNIIWSKFTGLKVPKTSIIYENGNSYVIKSKAGYNEKILVKIKKEDKKYCIIDNYNKDEIDQLKDVLKNQNINKKINIYDEILLNPDIKNL